MKTNHLTIKQEAFCQAYSKIGDEDSSYREAFLCAKMKPETIAKKASALLSESKIKARIKELKKGAGGRPSLYRPEYDEQAYKLCLLGATDKEIADFFDVDERTINNWKVEHPQFFQSVRAGKKVSDMEVASSLFQTTQDRIVKEQQAFKTKNVFYNEEGKRVEEERIEIVEVDKVIPADFRSQQFWLKNRKADSWRDKQDIDLKGDLTIQPITGMRIVNQEEPAKDGTVT